LRSQTRGLKISPGLRRLRFPFFRIQLSKSSLQTAKPANPGRSAFETTSSSPGGPGSGPRFREEQCPSGRRSTSAPRTRPQLIEFQRQSQQLVYKNLSRSTNVAFLSDFKGIFSPSVVDPTRVFHSRCVSVAPPECCAAPILFSSADDGSSGPQTSRHVPMPQKCPTNRLQTLTIGAHHQRVTRLGRTIAAPRDRGWDSKGLIESG
jgi:hypothetical protein